VADLAGPDGFAAIPTAAIDPPLVRRLPRSPRLWVRVPSGSGSSLLQHT
jgi:hypothetical protein